MWSGKHFTTGNLVICHQVHRLLVVLMSEGWLVGLIYDGLDSCNVVIVDCGT